MKTEAGATNVAMPISNSMSRAAMIYEAPGSMIYRQVRVANPYPGYRLTTAAPAHVATVRLITQVISRRAVSARAAASGGDLLLCRINPHLLADPERPIRTLRS